MTYYNNGSCKKLKGESRRDLKAPETPAWCSGFKGSLATALSGPNGCSGTKQPTLHWNRMNIRVEQKAISPFLTC